MKGRNMALPLAALGMLGAGTALGGLSSLFKKSPQQQTVPRLSPQQLMLQSQIGNLALQGLQNPYQGFEPIEERARSQFQTSTVPSLAERFTSMGSGGQRSSAFQGALGQAGSGLEQALAALRAQYGLQSRGLSQNLLSQSLNPNFDTLFLQHQPGFLESVFGNLAGPISQYGAMDLFGLLGSPNQAPGSFGTPTQGRIF